jgi:Ca-activated chloride channel homolog
VRLEEFLNYFDYGYPVPRDRSRPFSTTVAVAPSPWSEGRQIVHIGLKGYDMDRGERPPLNLVLLLDVSGSMAAPDKLPLAKQALTMLAGQLTARDRVSMVVYAGAAGVVLDPTRGTDTRAIVCALQVLEAGGSTAGGQGIERAYQLARANFARDGVNRVMLLSDGDFNVGISDPERLKAFVAEQRRTGIYLSVLGFGDGNYNDTMMQALAQNGNGTAAYIDTVSEARKVMTDEISGTLFPIANDVKAQVEFNPARVAEYRLIGYETRLLNREDFNNDAVDAGEIGAGHSVTAVYEITPVGGPATTDPLRYQAERRPGSAHDASEEIAFLRLRYKLPGQDRSLLIERPIRASDALPSLDQAPDSTRLAVAVAGFGQLMRADSWLQPGFGYGEVRSLLRTVSTPDPFGYRSELVSLTERAEEASTRVQVR